MKCFVYRSSKKAGLYVYLKDKDDLEKLPPPVLKQLGDAQFAMEFELTADRKLSQENPETVMKNLEERGFHLQMPRDIEDLLAKIAADKKNKIP